MTMRPSGPALPAIGPPSESHATSSRNRSALDRIVVAMARDASTVQAWAVVTVELHRDALDAVGPALHDAGRVEADHPHAGRLHRLQRGPRVARHDHHPGFNDHEVRGHAAMVLVGGHLDQGEPALLEPTIGLPRKLARIDDGHPL